LPRITLIFAVAALALIGVLFSSQSANAADQPTCSSELGIVVHGQHIVGDYITGIGHQNLDWPPSGGVVGDAVGGNGPVVVGGPGPGFHFPNGFAPGASFCIDQAQSDGLHF
jgi:hypothetical protein